MGKPVEGFTTVLLLIGLTSSFNIIAIGLVGEYVSEFIQKLKIDLFISYLKFMIKSNPLNNLYLVI